MKFNIEKMEIIPIGYRHPCTQIYGGHIEKNQPKQCDPLDSKIKVAKDRDVICLLGMWIGNKIDDMTPWEPIIDLIRKDIEDGEEYTLPYMENTS